MAYGVFNVDIVIPEELARKATEENVQQHVEDELGAALTQCSIRKVEINALPGKGGGWPDARIELDGPDKTTILREFRGWYDLSLGSNDIEELYLESIHE